MGVSKNLSSTIDGENAMNPVAHRTFVAKDRRRVILRSIRWEDLDDCVEFINSLVEEGADILKDTKVSREEEAEWLGKRLARIAKGELVDVVAEVNSSIVANSEVERREGTMNHVGYVGIGIRSGYRGIGIGTKIMETLIRESRKIGLKILVLDVFDSNKTAKGLYKKRAEFLEASTRKANTQT